MRKETISDLTTEKTELKREIGAFGGVSIIAGIMIGSGIFYLGAYVLQRVGMNSGLALLCWIIGGVIPCLAVWPMRKWARPCPSLAAVWST